MSKAMGDTLGRLDAVIHDRLAAGEAEASYVASLAAKGRGKIAQKFGEEAVETVIAAVSEDDSALIGEASDLIFHLSILLADRGLSWDDIAAELGRRHGTSGHAEKASRQQ
jgi:phosphoribosyl-ATP pyrophosphohydrolase